MRAWFPTDEAYLDYLDWLCWPDGFRCPPIPTYWVIHPRIHHLPDDGRPTLAVSAMLALAADLYA